MTLPYATVKPVYLDHAATTPVDPGVLEAMLPFYSERFGNPSSLYGVGQEARAAIDQARLGVARVLGCKSGEIVFTSGATESDNLALRGVAWAARLASPAGATAPHIVTTAIEHHAVLHTAQSLERQGFAATYVAPNVEGIVEPDAIAAAIRPETCLLSVMYANNETGAIQPVREISAIARQRGIPFHTDAVQAAGMLPLGVDELGVDLLSLSAHKFYGPKGVGLLYVRRGTAIDFQQEGGGQEQGRRGGTENVPGIVGLGHALEQAAAMRETYARHCAMLRDRLMKSILDAIPTATVNGPLDPDLRLPNNLNVSIPGVEGATLLLSLDLMGVAASTGSACTTGHTEPSHVLRAMGLSDEACRSALRFTVGRGNDAEQVDLAVAVLVEAVTRARDLASRVAD
jgi:cysteine desulfurase